MRPQSHRHLHRHNSFHYSPLPLLKHPFKQSRQPTSSLSFQQTSGKCLEEIAREMLSREKPEILTERVGLYRRGIWGRKQSNAEKEDKQNTENRGIRNIRETAGSREKYRRIRGKSRRGQERNIMLEICKLKLNEAKAYIPPKTSRSSTRTATAFGHLRERRQAFQQKLTAWDIDHFDEDF